jgi:hypothetical protein
MKYTVTLLVAALACALGTTAQATPGAMCMHRADCGEHEVCLADSDLSDHGHCTKLRVLP